MQLTVEPGVDGRRARGAASRQAIVDAAGRVILASGLEAATHRAVAEEADVSLARTTYHFPTIAALLRAVRLHLTDQFDARLMSLISAARARHTSIIDVCCDFLGELVGERRGELLATVELGVAAARRPELGSTGTRAGDGVIPIIRSFGTDEARARTIFASFYGFAVLAAMRSDRVAAAEIRDFVIAIIPSQPDPWPTTLEGDTHG